MGQAKREWMEAEERGWSSPEGHVCESCVDDGYLKKVISLNLVASECDFCGASSDEDIAAPVEELMPSIAGAVHHFYNDLTSAGVPWDGGPVFGGDVTDDVLMSLPLDCNDELFQAVTEAFLNTELVRAAGRNFASPHDHQVLDDSWDLFIYSVKRETRFHFHRSVNGAGAEWYALSPSETLDALGRVATTLGLVKDVAVGTKLYRARAKNPDGGWTPDEQSMGAPPKELARAGPMNPAGIIYFYCALEPQTATAETVAAPPVELAMASFDVTQDLRVLDLFNMPAVPSIFDEGRRHTYEPLLFIHRFVEEICQPVRKDGGEPIDYVPSQVVCEWFSQVFSPEGGESRLDRLMYPSAVRPGGRNLVLFPNRSNREAGSPAVSYMSSHVHQLATWADLGKCIGLP